MGGRGRCVEVWLVEVCCRHRDGVGCIAGKWILGCVGAGHGVGAPTAAGGTTSQSIQRQVCFHRAGPSGTGASLCGGEEDKDVGGLDVLQAEAGSHL